VCRALAEMPCRGLLHLSSYQVFPGNARKRYSEDAEPAPSGEAGRFWLACEQALAGVPNLSILRLGWLVDRNADALLGRVLRGLLAGQPLELDDSSRGSPVTVADLVRVVVAMAQQLASGAPQSGIYHYGAADTCTALEFAREVVERVKSFSAEDFSAQLNALDQTRQSGSAMLASDRLRDVFGIQQRSWRQGLTRQVELWLARLETGV
jgi:dTDP-4-dehydrorhamnose reductase